MSLMTQAWLLDKYGCKARALARAYRGVGLVREVERHHGIH